jgi:hypothetical protein
MFKKMIIGLLICCATITCFANDNGIKLLTKTDFIQEQQLGYRIRVVEIYGQKFVIVEKLEKAVYGKDIEISTAISIVKL